MVSRKPRQVPARKDLGCGRGGGDGVGGRFEWFGGRRRRGNADRIDHQRSRSGARVREGAMVILLTPGLGPGLAVGLALASRIQLTLTELLGALMVLPSKRPVSEGNR